MIKSCTDHMGNTFKSVVEKCRYWSIDVEKYRARIKYGWSEKDALEIKVKEKLYTDHKGNKFNSKKQMCEYWNVNIKIYNKRIKAGWSKKDALETKVIKYGTKQCIDHKGNKFKSEVEKCRYWSIDNKIYRDRIRRGWSEKDALETKVTNTCKSCIDHKGNKFKSKTEKCKYWGVTVNAYDKRKELGWSEKDALETKAKENSKQCTDHLGNTFKSIKEKCNYWGVTNRIYSKRINKGWLEEEALGIIPHFPLYRSSNRQVTDNLYIVSYIDNYCNCIYNNESIILHESIVKDICRKYNENRILKNAS